MCKPHADSDGKYRRPNSARRRALRERLMREQDGCCYWCRDAVAHGELDRVWPGKFGGTYAYENLVLSCTECNKQRGLTDARMVNKREAKSMLRVEIRVLAKARRRVAAK